MRRVDAIIYGPVPQINYSQAHNIHVAVLDKDDYHIDFAGASLHFKKVALFVCVYQAE